MQTILGMNLFKFDDGTTDEFKVSKHFWIFIVATVLLALVTLGLWYAWSHKERIRRSRPRLSPRLSRHMGRKEIDLQTLKAVKI